MILIVGIMNSSPRGTMIKVLWRSNSSQGSGEWIGWWIKNPFPSNHSGCRWTEAEGNLNPLTSSDKTSDRETPSRSNANNLNNPSSSTNNTRRNLQRCRYNSHLSWMKALPSWKNTCCFPNSSIWWWVSAIKSHQLIMRNQILMDGVQILPIQQSINLCSWAWGWRIQEPIMLKLGRKILWIMYRVSWSKRPLLKTINFSYWPLELICKSSQSRKSSSLQRKESHLCLTPFIVTLSAMRYIRYSFRQSIRTPSAQVAFITSECSH